MDKNQHLPFFEDELAKATTKRSEFLDKLGKIVPWKRIEDLTRPFYYKGERGNKPFDLSLMVRILVLQNADNLSDDAMSDEIINSRPVSKFLDIEREDQVPDGWTIGRFRHLIEDNGLAEKIFGEVNAAISERHLMLQKGTIVDSTLIAAPTSTKNKDGKRDPDAHSTKKGNNYYFGYKAHAAVDAETGLATKVVPTAANVADVTQTANLLSGKEDEVFGDAAYLGSDKRPEAVLENERGERIEYRINKRPSQRKGADESETAKILAEEKAKSSVRCRVEHVFAVVKGQLKFRKIRYRGMKKFASKVFLVFALANLLMAERRGYLSA